MNQRNAEFIMPYNERSKYPLVDNKLLTKELANVAGIGVPELYGKIDIQHDIAGLDEILTGRDAFVIKPASGAGGNGILVIDERRNGRFKKSSGLLLDRDTLEFHISSILSGMYSLGGVPDSALIEYRVMSDEGFHELAYQGVPDIRTIVFRGVPVMAMLRLPTQQSDGKANLHQGAVGAGIRLTDGELVKAVWQDKVITQHPDTGKAFAHFRVPHWQEILNLAARCYELVNLDYLGVDIVIDQERGPLVLELNARPGLSIQLANNEGLQRRLQYIQELSEIPADVNERIEIAKAFVI